MSDNQVIVNYEGPIRFETTKTLLQQVKIDLETHAIKKVLKKRVYSIMVECIENMLRHRAGAKESNVHPYIKLEKVALEYMVTAGNLILNSDVPILEETLKKVISSDKELLHKMYDEQINKEPDLTKNGAGLGIMTMALKANGKITYYFTQVNEKFSVFELRITVSID